MRSRATCINVKSIFRCGCYLGCFDGYFSLYHKQRASRKCQKVLKNAKKMRAQGKLEENRIRQKYRKLGGSFLHGIFINFSVSPVLHSSHLLGAKLRVLNTKQHFFYFYLSRLADGSGFSENCGFFHEFSGYASVP